MSRRLLSALAAGALVGCASAGQQQPPPQPGPTSGDPAPVTTRTQPPGQGTGGATMPAPAGGAPAPGAPAKPPLKSFDELTKGATARLGFFDTYEKDGNLYIVVPKARLNEEFLLSFQLAQGVGARGLFGGSMLTYEGNIVAFERHDERLFLVQRPTRFRAPAGSPAAKAVDLSFGASVLETAKIESMRKDSAIVVNIRDWIVSDLSDVGSGVRPAVAQRPGQPGRATLDKSRSYLESVKAFPENVNVRAKLTFTPGEPIYIPSVADSRYIPVTVAYSFAKLPAQPMAPRLADDRMGYFLSAHKDFTRDDDTFFVRYVNRWRLEAGEPAENGLVRPKKAVTYYIDPNVPEAYRPYLMAGVTAWNRAFEAAGWKDAIRAEMLPEGADPEDIRYPTLRWNTSDEAQYGAIGPSMVDPRTGEILDADILFEASMVRGFRNSWRTSASPAAAVEGMFTADEGAALGFESSSLGAELSAQGTLLRAVLAGRGEIGPNDPVPMEFVGQALTWVTMHEVGHTLGLRHNFRSSVDTPMDKLHDTAWTSEGGLYSSVMDYPSVNLAPQGQKNGLYYNTGIGSSDQWVVAYGYTADAARAATIAREAAKAGHAYGTDEDARGAGALDPNVNVYDLGADPLAWGKDRAALITALMPTLPQRVLADDKRYADLTDAFQTLLSQYARALATGVKYIGGSYQYRDHVGDPDGRAPFVPVPKAKQLEALAFLNERAFGEKAFSYSPALLSQLGANRWSHWGETNSYEGRIDYPLHEQVLGAQRAIVNQVMNPFVFARIRDAEMKYGREAVLSIPELMSSLTGSMWAEAYGASSRNVTATRRDLQRLYLDRMSELVLEEQSRMPADARAVARYQMTELKRRIDGRLAAGASLDAYTRAHYAESSARIGKVLSAEVGAK